MFFFLFFLIKSTIFDHAVPHLFDTIEDYAKYNPNLYNYDIIHKEFDEGECLKTNRYRFDECIKYSMKKFYKTFSLISANNQTNYLIKTIAGNSKTKPPKINESTIQSFWYECGLKGNEKCIELFEIFNFFNKNLTDKNFTFEENETKLSTIFGQLREAHDIMYRIGRFRSMNRNEKETEQERENRFQKAYEILKPIAFLAFEKYISDHFGSLRPLHRINRSLVEKTLGYNTAYKHELKILLNGTEIEKDPSWIFGDIVYPEVAKLLNDIVTRRKGGPDYPLNIIYSTLLKARFPYLFEDGLNNKDRYQIVKSHIYRDFDFGEFNLFQSEFGDFFIGDDLYQHENADNFLLNDNEVEKENKSKIYDNDKLRKEIENVIKGEDEANNDEEKEFFEYEYNEEVDGYYYFFYQQNMTKRHQMFYDYYFDDKKYMNDQIHVFKIPKTEPTYNYIISKYENYHKIATNRLGDVCDLCYFYLQNVENIESFNQSNLTAKIATIYGIDNMFNIKYDGAQFLFNTNIYNSYDSKSNLVRCRLVEESLFYLIIAAKHGELRAIEALIFKFFLLMNETNETKSIDSYFDLVLDEFSDFYDKNKTKSNPPNIYVHYHNSFSSFVADFFDSIIFFDEKMRNYFQVDSIIDFNTTYQIDENNVEVISEGNEEQNKYKYIYKNPRNWTFEDAAKALRRFIDASFLVQSGHLAEYALSSPSSYISFRHNVYNYLELPFKIGGYIIDKIQEFVASLKNKVNKTNKDEKIDEDEKCFIINDKIINKRAFTYALRVYQTLALSGNRDAMWNAHILMKVINQPNQHFTMFITDSNETVFLHELDAFHRKSHMINKTDILEQNEEISNNEIQDNRSIKSYLNLMFKHISNLFSINGTNKFEILSHDDCVFYEEISDYDPYAAFTLAWNKRRNLTAAFTLLDKTENMKPEAKVAVVISKMIITTLSFFDSVFKRNAIVSSSSSFNDVNNTSSSNFFINFFNSQKYEKIGEIIKSTPYLPEVLLGLGILIVLSFFIYIRISLYID